MTLKKSETLHNEIAKHEMQTAHLERSMKNMRKATYQKKSHRRLSDLSANSLQVGENR